MDRFVKILKGQILIQKGKGALVDIWYDKERINGSTYITGVIAAAIKKSATFICITSRSYYHSISCKNEFEPFCRIEQRDLLGLEELNQSRMFNVLLFDISDNERPEALRGTIGYNFYKSVGKDLTYPLETESEDFKTAMHRLMETLIPTINNIISYQEKEKYINIFLAASSTVENEVKAIEGVIEDKNKLLSNKNIRIKLKKIYDFGFFEDVFKEKLIGCNFFIMPFDIQIPETIRKATELAWEQSTGPYKKPTLLLYGKTISIKKIRELDNLDNRRAFEDWCDEKSIPITDYADIRDLIIRLKGMLDYTLDED